MEQKAAVAQVSSPTIGGILAPVAPSYRNLSLTTHPTVRTQVARRDPEGREPSGILEPNVLYLQLVSEQQFETKLSDTRCGGRLYESEVCCVNVPLHILKLGMVKGVEELCPELQIRFLGQLGVFQ